MDEATIRAEVSGEFRRLVDALNRVDTAAWAEHYSRDGFVSAIAGAERCDTRDAWIRLVSGYFEGRKCQQVDPVDLRVTPLAPGLALMTSEETSAMTLKDGAEVRSKHAFTMVWRKEPGGWKVVHSHESWVDAKERSAR